MMRTELPKVHRLSQAKLKDPKPRKEQCTLLGKLGNLWLWMIVDWYDSRGRPIDFTIKGIFESKPTCQEALELRLEKRNRGWRGEEYNQLCYDVAWVCVASKFQGFGIMPTVYKEVMKKTGVILVSDDSQSLGGRNIWYNLNKDPQVLVMGNPDRRKLELVESDPDEGELVSEKHKIYDKDTYALYAQYIGRETESAKRFKAKFLDGDL